MISQRVMIKIGSIRLLKDEDGLAWFLSGSIANIVSNHFRENSSLGSLEDINPTFKLISAIPYFKRLVKSYKEKKTDNLVFETDYISLVMMAKAGFNIHRGVGYLERRRRHYLQSNSSYKKEPELFRKVSRGLSLL